MPLKTVVKVGNISNLSDARYCSGMGVDMLGFCVIEGQPHYISPKLFQEIRGWISGPKVVAQVYGLQSEDELQSIIKNYLPDYLELSAKEYERYHSILTLPCIVEISDKHVPSFEAKSPAYVIVSDVAQLNQDTPPALLKVDSGEDLLKTLESSQLKGVVLNGSPEIRPGFKDYGTLADILELLDE